jgi:XTP/dITP diphosphohydrolase
LLIVTDNPGKMREYRALLADLPAQLRFPADLGRRIKVEEVGATYAENAALKARAGVEASGLLSLADDSGLEVDALGGEPGIRSARYIPGSDADRIAALLARMDSVPWEQRTARFRCCIAIMTPEGAMYTAEGTCEGVIACVPMGTGGFGYDPVFYIPEFSCTMAQLSPEVKNRISHRARAVEAARPILWRLLLEDTDPRGPTRASTLPLPFLSLLPPQSGAGFFLSFLTCNYLS